MPEEAKKCITEDKQVEEAKATLERINSWINNCDTKTGAILALLGVILTLVLTNEGLSTCREIASKAMASRTFSDILYLIIWFVSFACLILGLFKLISALFATTSSEKFKQGKLETDSRIFFGSIGTTPTYQEYRDKFTGMTISDYINDLLSQVYINSLIASKKFKNYNQGLKYAIIGFCWFIVMLIIGNFVYL